MKIETLFSPAEFEALGKVDLSGTTAVVFDVLRATTSIMTALAKGAEAVIPVGTIEEALREKQKNPGALLAGERDGFRIHAGLTGGVDFDLGNSPREFGRGKVAGKTIVMTTTNGTRALKACAGAKEVLIGSIRNVGAVARWVREQRPEQLLIVCSGTYEEASFEDTLGAGALATRVWDLYEGGQVADSAQIARMIYEGAKSDLPGAARWARNGRRLLGIPELKDDVGLCLTEDGMEILARMEREGAVRVWSGNTK